MLTPRCFDLPVSMDVPEEYNAELKVKRGLGLVNKLSFIFSWLRLRLAVSAKLGLPTSRESVLLSCQPGPRWSQNET